MSVKNIQIIIKERETIFSLEKQNNFSPATFQEAHSIFKKIEK